MKRLIILILVGYLTSHTLFSQNISLNDLITICNKKQWEDVNRVLLNKSWEYYDSKQGDSNSYHTITWSYNKGQYNDQAQAWFYLYTYEGFPNKVSYIVFNLQSYNQLANSLAKYGFKLSNSEINDNSVASSYSSKNFILKIKTSKQEKANYSSTSITTYDFTLIKKESIYDPDNGKKKDYFPNGKIQAEYILKEGKIHGPIKAYHENGRIARTGNYVNGNENGSFIEYDEYGNKTHQYPMVYGSIHGNIKTFEEGRLTQERQFKQGILNGKGTNYYYRNNGELYMKIVCYYLDAKLDGKLTAYSIDEEEEEIWYVQNYKGDKKHGYFEEYTGLDSDTLIEANYDMGKLHGAYLKKVYTKVFSENGESFGIWFNDEEGEYMQGQKHGKWIEYSIGTKTSEGYYNYNEKEGLWLTYVPYGSHSGEIMREVLYETGLKHGTSHTYFNIKTVQDTADEGNLMRFISYPIDIVETYKNDRLNGVVIACDSLGTLIAKGSCKDDNKEGEWIESYLIESTENEPFRIYIKGNYKMGLMEGNWIEYIQEGIPIKTSHYYHGELDGEEIVWKSIGEPRETIVYDAGDLESITVHDSISLKPIRKYEIYDQLSTSYRCRFILYLPDGRISQEYWLKNPGEINPNVFDLTFMIMDEFSDETYIHKDGKYQVFDSEDRIIIDGNMYKENRSQVWTYYYYNQEVKVLVPYINYNPSVENYYILPSDKPYSGDFTWRDEEGNYTELRKIKNGLRHGKTLRYDNDGNQISKEVYKKGVIQ